MTKFDVGAISAPCEELVLPEAVLLAELNRDLHRVVAPPPLDPEAGGVRLGSQVTRCSN